MKKISEGAQRDTKMTLEFSKMSAASLWPFGMLRIARPTFLTFLSKKIKIAARNIALRIKI